MVLISNENLMHAISPQGVFRNARSQKMVTERTRAATTKNSAQSLKRYQIIFPLLICKESHQYHEQLNAWLAAMLSFAQPTPTEMR